jgi:Tachylectin
VVARALAVTCAAALLAVGQGASPAMAAACGPAEGFTRLSGGALYRLQDQQVAAGTGTLGELGVVGSGWGGFAWTGAGGDGVLYALTKSGNLLWYRYDTARAAWLKGSGTVVGSGFVPGTSVVNIAVGANGWIYVVRTDGKLVLYRHVGRLAGEATWGTGTGTGTGAVGGGGTVTGSGSAVGSGLVIGSGWTGDELIAPQGDGTIYRQLGGNLYWFRHTDPAAGSVTWANSGAGVKIGSGWWFYDLLPLGAGVLLATSSPSGQVSLYQHGDPVGGTAAWGALGVKKYLARPDSYGVTVAPNTCT